MLSYLTTRFQRPDGIESHKSTQKVQVSDVAFLNEPDGRIDRHRTEE